MSRLNNIITTPDSSLVKQIAYDPTKSGGILELVFENSRYRYYKVPPKVFADFITRDSTGKAYNELIKGKFRIRQMKVPNEQLGIGSG